MKFEKQIEGVPMDLVRQGWRRAPTKDTHDKWMRVGNQWRWPTLLDSGIRIALPIRSVTKARLSCSINRYAHEGWGDGLSPTPEMVKVWKWWWVSDSPVHVRFVNGSMVVQHPFADSIENHTHEWRGPVLPPMEG